LGKRLTGQCRAGDNIDVRALRLDRFLNQPGIGLLVDTLGRAAIMGIIQKLNVR